MRMLLLFCCCTVLFSSCRQEEILENKSDKETSTRAASAANDFVFDISLIVWDGVMLDYEFSGTGEKALDADIIIPILVKFKVGVHEDILTYTKNVIISKGSINAHSVSVVS